MIYLGIRNWSFTPEGQNEKISGSSAHLAKEISPEDGQGFETVKQGFRSDFDFKLLDGIKPLDFVNCYFDDKGKVQFIQKANK